MALLDGLTHWWDLDEESGTRLDSHGLKDLTDRNTVGSVVVGSGRAASFVAANDEQLYSSGITGPSETTPFAMAVRFRIPESGGGGDLFTPGISSNSKLIIAADGQITFNVKHATQTWDSSITAASTPGSWHTAVALFDGTTAYLYIDGVYVSSVAGRRKTGNPGSDRLGIGNCDNIFDKSGTPLTGDIDYVGYWHERALTEEEITALQSVTSYADLSGGTPEPVTLSAALTLGSISLSGTLTRQAALSGSLTLAQIAAAGTIAREGQINAALSLGNLSVSGTLSRQAALNASLNLGSLVASGQITREAALSAALTLGQLSVSGTIGTPPIGVSGALTLSPLSASGTLTREAVLSASLTLGQLAATGQVSREAAIEAALTLANLRLSGQIGKRAELATLEIALRDALTLTPTLKDSIALSLNLTQ